MYFVVNRVSLCLDTVCDTVAYKLCADNSTYREDAGNAHTNHECACCLLFLNCGSVEEVNVVKVFSYLEERTDGVCVLCEIEVAECYDVIGNIEYVRGNVERRNCVGKGDEISYLTVEHYLLQRLGIFTLAGELQGTEDVVVNGLVYIVLVVIVIVRIDSDVSRKGELVVFIQVDVDEVVVDLNEHQGH